MPDWTWLAASTGFALVTAISPGPVNFVTLSQSLRGQVAASVRFISGATLGFVLQLCLLGLGLRQLLQLWPWLAQLLHWGGILFLLWMAYLLWHANTGLDGHPAGKPAGWIMGALMQWLNPKAYLTIAAAVGLYVGNQPVLIYWLAAVYAVVCWLSLAVWLVLGCWLRRHARSPQSIRHINRMLSFLLLASMLLLYR